MSLLVDDEGFVTLTPPLLELFECPLHGFWRLQHLQPGPSIPALVDRATHLVLFELARQSWPPDYAQALPSLVTQALRSQWSRFNLPEERFEPENSRLLALLSHFLATWHPPTGERVCPHLFSSYEDQREGIRYQAHLDLAVAPRQRPGVIQVVDWRRGPLPSADHSQLLMPVVLQATLAIRRLSPPSRVSVSWVDLETGEERDMLAGIDVIKAFRAIHRLARDIRETRWVAHPCHLCPSCPVRGCRYQPDLPEAREFALTTLEDFGLSFWRRPDAAPSSEPGA